MRRLVAVLVTGAVIAPLAAFVKWPKAVEVLIAFIAGMATMYSSGAASADGYALLEPRRLPGK
jgi:hypothetical protein